MAACEGDTGPAGPAGPEGPAGDPGGDGDTVVISATAQYGLDIAPVELTLDGLTLDQLEQVGRGSYIVNAVGMCAGCHSTEAFGIEGGQYLAGGAKLALPGGFFVFARNLTPDAETGMTLTEDQFVTVMRTGEDFRPGAEGEALIPMPWWFFRWMSIADIKAIYAYLKVIPAVSNAVEADMKGTFAANTPDEYDGTYDMGAVERELPSEDFPDLNNVRRGTAVHPLADVPGLGDMDGATQAQFGRGSYLVSSGWCAFCHSNPSVALADGPTVWKLNTTNHMTGGRFFKAPPGLNGPDGYTREMSANLIGENQGYFNRAVSDLPNFNMILEEAVFHDGRPLAFPMKYNAGTVLSNMSAEDKAAIFTYLNIVADRQGPTGASDKTTQPPARFCMGDGDCEGGETCHIDATIGNECVGGNCSVAADCGTCQTCAGTCQAPAADSTCLTSGI